MMKRFSGLLILLFTVAIPVMASSACERPSRLRFSFFPQGQLLNNGTLLQPMFKELSAALHIPVESVSMPSYGAVMEGLLAGSIDIARLGPASYATVRKSNASITPFATLVNKPDIYSVKSTVAYYSLLIVRQNSHFTIASLKGKKLALADPDSTSGALIPLNIFSKEIGTPLTSYFSRIGYSGSHEQSVRLVMNREVDAAFVASTSLAMLTRDGAIKQNDVRVLWQSQALPHDPFVYRTQLCADIRQKIQKVFFDTKNPSVAATLDALHAEKFVPVADSDYQMIRDLQLY
ncbi:MAG TPA: phosphate/phosphite/phosphonate ABC transporter substrate-binding protein [Herbaspirillum sp.]|nr:phosphate/phosphite/phosphonate ABC transporter substrate-binding protein [Herbaspirillum sp.]